MIYFDNNKNAYDENSKKKFNIQPICSIEDQLWYEFSGDPDSWTIVDGKFVDLRQTAEYKQKQKAKQKEHISMLNLTGADVERGIYKAKGMDFEDIVQMVTKNPPKGLDVKALKIELKANNFYRGNPYVDAIGSLLGFSSYQLDKFFETNDYNYLL